LQRVSFEFGHFESPEARKQNSPGAPKRTEGGLGYSLFALRAVTRLIFLWASIAALLSGCSFPVILRGDVARDSCPDIGVYRTVQRTDPFPDDRHVLTNNFRDEDFLGTKVRRRRIRSRTAG
jgi:hypothetical protein